MAQTFGVISSFFSYMAQHPDVQAKAQAEIDTIVGPSRLPTLSDRPLLLYVNALISEVQRYSVVAPLGIAHTAQVDGVHNGYFIPKRSIILSNAW
jgi:cytochrome P450